MSGIVLTEVADATIPAPAAGKVTVYMSTEEAGPAFKDDADVVTPLQGATGATGATGPSYSGTSTTSLAIGTGSKTFTTQAGRAYVAGTRVRAASDADPTVDYMEGVVTSYSGTSLIVTMDLAPGSGTHTDWNLTLAGDVGATGAGVPPTVVAHGAMGAAETFDYGDGPAHSAEADAACTWTFSGATAGEVIMTVYLEVDSGGPYAITLPASVANKTEAEAFLAAVAASTSAIVPFVTIDSGTTWVAILDESGGSSDLDAIITASAGQDIADALSGAAAPDAGNVFATMADVGGGGDYVFSSEIVAGVGGLASIDFTGIPGTGRHLVIECMLRGEKAAAFDDLSARVNNDSGANYDKQFQSAFQTTNAAAEALATTSWATVGQPAAASATAGLFSYYRFEFPYYASTVYRKVGYMQASELTANASGSILVRHGALFWRSTAAITQFTLFFAGGDVAEGSAASLYLIG